MVTGARKRIEDLVEYYQRHLSFLVDDDYYDTEALLVLTARDEIEDRREELTPQQEQQIAGLDRDLAAKHEFVAWGIPGGLKQDRRRWWWFLHEGPQVREQARKLEAV